jgi:hypothetical protein
MQMCSVVYNSIHPISRFAASCYSRLTPRKNLTPLIHGMEAKLKHSPFRHGPK